MFLRVRKNIFKGLRLSEGGINFIERIMLNARTVIAQLAQCLLFGLDNQGNIIRFPTIGGGGKQFLYSPNYPHRLWTPLNLALNWCLGRLSWGVKRPRLYLVLLTLRISGSSPPIPYLLLWNLHHQHDFYSHHKTNKLHRQKATNCNFKTRGLYIYRRASKVLPNTWTHLLPYVAFVRRNFLSCYKERQYDKFHTRLYSGAIILAR